MHTITSESQSASGPLSSAPVQNLGGGHPLTSESQSACGPISSAYIQNLKLGGGHAPNYSQVNHRVQCPYQDREGK